MQSSGLEVGDELYLTLAVSGSGRNSQRTQTFGSILKAQSSGEHAVTGAILENIRLTDTYHIEQRATKLAQESKSCWECTMTVGVPVVPLGRMDTYSVLTHIACY